MPRVLIHLIKAYAPNPSYRTIHLSDVLTSLINWYSKSASAPRPLVCVEEIKNPVDQFPPHYKMNKNKNVLIKEGITVKYFAAWS